MCTFHAVSATIARYISKKCTCNMLWRQVGYSEKYASRLTLHFPRENIWERKVRSISLATGPYYYINGLINLAIISYFCLLLFRFKRNRQRTRSSSDTVSYHFPSNWSPINPSEEFKVVELNEVLDHDEYSKVKAQFMSTMSGFNVKSVKRVQNPSLWEDYER